MHAIHYTILPIASADLPTIVDHATETRRPATDADLLNFGIQPLHEDLYSVVEEYRRDPTTLAWSATGHEHVGASDLPSLSMNNPNFDLGGWVAARTIAAGAARYRDLPTGIREKVLLARIVQPVSGVTTALAVAEANLAEQSAAIDDNVGSVDGSPLVDLSAPTAAADEASRLARIPDSGLELVTIPMALVDPTAHVVEADGLEPHRWAGERTW